MDTLEHLQLGNQIRILRLGNPYLLGEDGLSSDVINNLRITMMQEIDGIPVPLHGLVLSAGEVVAMAGDYFTKAGWGLKLNTTDDTLDSEAASKKLLTIPIEEKETKAFHQAFGDLASHHTHYSTIQRIFSLEKSRFVPSLLKELIYALTVRKYGKKLSNNEAHFAPWSVRAYLVAHESALKSANIAYSFQEMLKNPLQDLPAELDEIIKKIKANPKKFGFEPYKNPAAKYQFKLVGDTEELTDKKLFTELQHRYHALAVAQDLFAMHFYSDHFAAGHMSRMGKMRQLLPQRFGFLGGILVNNMHNEDNSLSVTSTNGMLLPPQPNKPGEFYRFRKKSAAYGDGTYMSRGNAGNRDMLINGMDNSFGDITRLMLKGKKREPTQYGGLAFLNDVDFSKKQTAPLFIHQDNTIYYRRNLSKIAMLSPQEYQGTVKDPLHNGYAELNYFSAMVLVIKLRVFSFLYSPKIEPISKTRGAEIFNHEVSVQKQVQPITFKCATLSTKPISDAQKLGVLGMFPPPVKEENEDLKQLTPEIPVS